MKGDGSVQRSSVSLRDQFIRLSISSMRHECKMMRHMCERARNECSGETDAKSKFFQSWFMRMCDPLNSFHRKTHESFMGMDRSHVILVMQGKHSTRVKQPLTNVCHCHSKWFHATIEMFGIFSNEM